MEFHGGKSAELSVYEELTARQRRHDAEHGFCLWTMVDESGQVIGFTGAQPWPQDWGPKGEIEIGWRLGRAHWGKGYATAAAELTLERVRSAGVVERGRDGPGPQRAVHRGHPAAGHATRRGVHDADAGTGGALLPAPVTRRQ